MENKKSKKFLYYILVSVKALLLGQRFQQNDEANSSSSSTSLKKIIQNKRAITCIFIIIVLELAIFILSYFFRYDQSNKDYSQQNVPPCVSFLSIPKELNGSIRSLSIGSTFGACINHDGKLYTWGILDNNVTRLLRKSLNSNKKYVAVSSGLNHIIAINNKGMVETWAPNRFGLNDIPPELVNRRDVVQVAAGYQFSVAITLDGSIFIWGNTSMLGGLSQDAIQGSINGRAKKIAINTDNIIILTNEGVVKVFGEKNDLIKKDLSSKKVADIAVTDYAIAVLTTDGNINVWGTNVYGLLDVPDDLDSNTIAISAGRKHFIALDKNGLVHSWGDNSYHQSSIPRDIKIGKVKVNKIYSGYYQNYALDESDNILSWGLKGYPMGTDDYGRDVFSKFLAGGKVTLLIGLAAFCIQFIFGVSIGCIAGYYGRIIDKLFITVTEIIGYIPLLPVAVTILALLGSDITDNQRIIMIIILLGLLGISNIARLVRNLVKKEKSKDYVVAAKATGVRSIDILIKQIVPNIITNIIANATLAYADCLLIESTISYLGFGATNSYITWGSMLSDLVSTGVLRDYWWRWFFPALGLSVFIILVNYFGYAISVAIDPKEDGDRRRLYYGSIRGK